SGSCPSRPPRARPSTSNGSARWPNAENPCVTGLSPSLTPRRPLHFMGMARHRSESNNFSVAGWVIAVFILAIALIAAAIWWFGFRQPEAPQAQECIQGDLNLPVAAEGVDATALIDDYNASDPVVRDFCITAELTDSVARAAVLLTPAGTDVAELLDGRSLSSTTPV